MREIRYADAGMDMKKLMLCFMQKLWIAVVAAAAGAVAGALVYLAVSVVPEAERQYQAMAKVYLDFAADETGEVYQEYNGYTWNDLMATDPILDVTMQYVPEDYTREEVTAATRAEILSDLRLLTITITTHDIDRCSTILEATGRSLEDLGNTAKEFRQITVIQKTEAALVTADSRMAQAVMIGSVLAVVATLLGMMFVYVLDDRIMVASDLRQATDVPFVGYTGVCERLQKDYEANLSYLREKKGKIVTLSARQGESVAEGKWQELCEAEGVVLEVPYRKMHVVYLSYLIEMLAFRECPLVGAAIAGAPERFLDRYYGRESRANGRKDTTSGIGSR